MDLRERGRRGRTGATRGRSPGRASSAGSSPSTSTSPRSRRVARRRRRRRLVRRRAPPRPAPADAQIVCWDVNYRSEDLATPSRPSASCRTAVTPDGPFDLVLRARRPRARRRRRGVPRRPGRPARSATGGSAVVSVPAHPRPVLRPRPHARAPPPLPTGRASAPSLARHLDVVQPARCSPRCWSPRARRPSASSGSAATGRARGVGGVVGRPGRHRGDDGRPRRRRRRSAAGCGRAWACRCPGCRPGRSPSGDGRRRREPPTAIVVPVLRRGGPPRRRRRWPSWPQLADARVVLVDDGSTDGTPAVLDRPRRRPIPDASTSSRSPTNRGKGEAVRPRAAGRPRRRRRRRRLLRRRPGHAARRDGPAGRRCCATARARRSCSGPASGCSATTSSARWSATTSAGCSPPPAASCSASTCTTPSAAPRCFRDGPALAGRARPSRSRSRWVFDVELLGRLLQGPEARRRTRPRRRSSRSRSSSGAT